MGTARLRPDLATLLGAATVLLHFVLAVAFHEERTAFVDLAFHLYEHATTGAVAIQNHRFVSALTQWVPVALLNAGVELRWVQLAYSLAFPALYGLTWALLRWPLRSPRWALAWILPWLTFVTHDYYWIQSELPQGLAVLTLALALVGRRPAGAAGQVLAKAARPCLLLAAAFAHPLLIVPVAYALGCLYLVRLAPKRDLLTAGAWFGGAWLLRMTAFSSAYEMSAAHPGRGLLWLLFEEVPPSLARLPADFVTAYYATALALVAAVGLLARQGHRGAAAWTAACCLGHLLLVALSNPVVGPAAFYIENLYLPAAWMAAVGLSFCVAAVGPLAPKPAVSIAIAALVIARFGQIVHVGLDTYRPRLERLGADLERYADQKTLLLETPELTEAYLMTWGTGYEAWVWSARRGLPTRGFLIAPSAEPLRWALNDPERLVTKFLMPRFAELPPRYFANPDPERGYRVVRVGDEAGGGLR